MEHDPYAAMYGRAAEIGRKQLPYEQIKSTKTGSTELRAFVAGVVNGTIASIPFGPGLEFLSRMTQALIPGTVTTICGDPGIGKTFFVLQMLRYWHASGLDPAAFFLEETLRFYLNRLLAQLEGDGRFTDLTWMRNNGDDVFDALDRHKEILNDFCRMIFMSPRQPNMKDLADWVTAKAAEGKRIIVVDPITAVDAGMDRYRADDLFMTVIPKALDRFGASLILMTHPTKTIRVGAPSMNDKAGGAAYSRFAACDLSIVKLKKPKKVHLQARTAGGGFHQHTAKLNTFVHIHKARNGKGTNMEIGMLFGEGLMFAEQGLVLREAPSEGESEAPSDPNLPF